MNRASTGDYEGGTAVPAGRKPKACAELIRALALGVSPEAAAQKSGVSVRTVYRRLADAEFRAEVDRQRTAILDRAVGMSGAGTLGSVKTLTMLQDAAKSESVRLGAARALVDVHVKLRQSAEQQARIEALEAQLRQLLEPGPAPSDDSDES
jgi:hypothetical protein